ncbi:MAG: ribonuclease H-like YkuK family protein [Actinobacteria bacterium]|nr:ribonuclease H-like YkuK family protein [Actinomycetota bacterium]
MINGFFQSVTYGKLTLQEVRKHILKYMSTTPKNKFRIVIGSDSQPKEEGICDFVTALVVHNIGKGGIYFWKRKIKKNGLKNNHFSISRLRERIYEEASLSLITASEFLELVKEDGITKYDVEIHVDVGQFGETREMIAEVVGMIRGSGFICKTKPDSYGASKIADRHT